MELVTEAEAILVDHEDALLRIASIVGEIAQQVGVLTNKEADDFVDEIADLLAVDLEMHYEDGLHPTHPVFGAGELVA